MSPETRNVPAPAPVDRRTQILGAAVTCFARRGLHQATMHDISEQAGISVGLIYRYFASKEEVIASMAREHVEELRVKIDEARAMPTLADALDHVLWCDHEAEVAASFVVDLHAEAARNPQVNALVRDVRAALAMGIGRLIEASPEADHLAPGLLAHEAADVIVQGLHGHLFDEIAGRTGRGHEDAKRARVAALRRLLTLLFPGSARSTEGRHAP